MSQDGSIQHRRPRKTLQSLFEGLSAFKPWLSSHSLNPHYNPPTVECIYVYLIGGGGLHFLFKSRTLLMAPSRLSGPAPSLWVPSLRTSRQPAQHQTSGPGAWTGCIPGGRGKERTAQSPILSSRTEPMLPSQKLS